MDVHSEIMERIARLGLTVRVDEHPPLYTMADVARLGVTPVNQRVKTLLVRGREDFILCGVGAETKLRFAGLAQTLAVSRESLRFASEDELSRALRVPYGALGLVAPVSVVQPRIALSRRFRSVDFVSFGSGRNDRTITVRVTDLERRLSVEFGDID